MHAQDKFGLCDAVVVTPVPKPPCSSQPGAVQPAGVCKGRLWALWSNTPLPVLWPPVSSQPCAIQPAGVWSVGCVERYPFSGPHSANSPTANQQVHAKVCRVIPILITPRCSQPYGKQAGECKSTVEVVHSNELLPLTSQSSGWQPGSTQTASVCINDMLSLLKQQGSKCNLTQ